MRTPRAPRLSAAAATLLAVTMTTAGCSGGGSPDAENGGTSPAASTPTTAATALPSWVPQGVEVTEPGTQLAFGDTATVLRRGHGKRGVLEVTVESARRGVLKDFVGFDLDSPYKRQGSYYYVRVQLRNGGTTPLAGGPVPLWGISGDNTLLQPVQFTSSFAKCPTEDLPSPFGPGARFQTCLVYLSPDRGDLEGVSYRPSRDDVPIEWRGAVEAAPKAGAGKPKASASATTSPSPGDGTP